MVMLKRFFSPLTLVNQLTLIVLFSAAIAVTEMAVSGWLVEGVRGSAHAINKAGSLRMQSYRLLSEVPLQVDDYWLLSQMERTVFSEQLQVASRHDGQQEQLQMLQLYWQKNLAPELQQATNADSVADKVVTFVSKLDHLVGDFDHTTERRVEQVLWLQRVMVIFMTVLFIFTILWLRMKLLRPWKQLLSMAQAVSHRDFSYRARISGRNEMAALGMALNNMSAELAHSYDVLEQRIREKTADLERKNQILAFLWQASRRLHSPATLYERLLPVLHELQHLTCLGNIRLQVYDEEDEANQQEFFCRTANDCTDRARQLCSCEPLSLLDCGTTLKWRLSDGHHHYGLLLATLPEQQQLEQDQQQMIDTLAEQITATLAIERQQERQKQMVVMAERATIARELHDSIAQSLSCMKMQISCLQMGETAMSVASQSLLGQIRQELDNSWLQLRELLTTFRLQLSQTGLRAALEASCQEFSKRFAFPVALDYQLPPQLVPSHQGIHLLQITREALNNALKHANATAVNVDVWWHNNQVHLRIRDNGCGVPNHGEHHNHYGMIIMRDRAQSLCGECQIQRRETGGTDVIVRFSPENGVRASINQLSVRRENDE